MSDNNVNASVNDALPSVIEYVTQSGVLIRITPLSFFLIQALRNKSEALFEYPPEKDYRLTEQLNESGEMVQAADVIASGFFPASENPEYVELCKEIDQKRGLWVDDAVVELAFEYPQFVDRDALMAHFRPALEKIRPYVDMPSDEWKAILDFCVFTGTMVAETNDRRIRTHERIRVIQLATQNSNLMLSTPEVVDGLRIFSVHIPK